MMISKGVCRGGEGRKESGVVVKEGEDLGSIKKTQRARKINKSATNMTSFIP
jgi:hypothetical protein